jgi:signal transduction histidine kinase
VRLPLTFILVLVIAECFGQEVDLSGVDNSIQLDSSMMMYYDTSWSDDFITVPFDAYQPPPQTGGPQWHYASYFKVAVHNDTQKDFSGVIYIAKASAQLFTTNTKGEILKTFEPVTWHGPGMFEEQYFPVTIPRDSTWTFVIRSQNNLVFQHVSAWIVEASFTDTFLQAYTSTFFDMTFLHCIIGGMLAMMFLYVLAQFVLFRTPEYGYYAAYIFTMLFFLFANSWEVFEFDFLGGVKNWYGWMNNTLQVVAYGLYFAFLIYYFKARNSDRLLYHVLRIAIVVLLVFIVVNVAFIITIKYFPIWWWTGFRLALALLVAWMAFRVWNLRMPYARYPIYGGITFLTFALISLLIDRAEGKFNTIPWPFNYEMFYYFTGVALEMIFFSLGLANKRRQDAIDKVEAEEALKLEVERQQVRHLNALSEVQESERSRFAKDLHDGLGGMLSGVKLSLSNMKGNVVLAAEHVDVFERALDMLDNSIHELRRVAHNLMPESLVKFGLAASLKDFCDFINSSKVITVIFQQIGTYKRLEMSVEVVLYRIANELVNNTLRHASATELIIQLNYDDHSLTLTVEDNGKGFDQNVLERTTGSGWPNIKSRVAFLKGLLDVQTSAGNGTSVNITIPL